MVTKELLDARWRMVLGALGVPAVAVVIVYSYVLIRDLLGSAAVAQLPAASRSDLELALGSFDLFVWSQWFPKNAQPVLGLFAAFLGGPLIAGEVSKSTIFLLLGKPVGRAQVLLTKYAVGAAILLGVTLLGSLGLVATAAVLGHPQPLAGMLLSTVLLWLGVLAVLGVGLLCSVLFDDVLRPVALAVVFALAIGVPSYLPGGAPWSLPTYWSSLPAYQGTGVPWREFAVCLVAAALPVALALPLFRRRAY